MLFKIKIDLNIMIFIIIYIFACNAFKSNQVILE
jgi:hypothetical protein